MRLLSSAAASRVNVTAHNRPLSCDVSSRMARSESTRVFPDPGQASTVQWPAVDTARSWNGLSSTYTTGTLIGLVASSGAAFVTGTSDGLSVGIGSLRLAAVIARPAKLLMPPETLRSLRFHS